MTPRRIVFLYGLGLCLAAVPGALAAAPPPVPAATGASVDESRVQKTYYVDAASAEASDDDRHGTQDEPFATVARACRAAADDKDRNIGVKIIIAPGVYREAAEIRAPPKDQPDTDAPIIIEAAEREQAIIDGAEVEGWTASTWKTDAPPNYWTHPWPFQRNAPTPRSARAPAVAPAAGTYRRGNLLFVNGSPMRQVEAAADLAPGTVWLTDPAAAGPSAAGPARERGRRRAAAPEASASPSPAPPAFPGGSVVVQPTEGTEIASAVIQTGRRDHGLAVMNRRNVVVRGLLFQHAANPEGRGGADSTTAGLLLVGCSNVLVEDVLSQWNDGVGLVMFGRTTAPWTEGVTLRRVRLLHNGGSGLYAANLKNLLVEDCETSFNNFRGEWAGWIDPVGQAGAKLLSLHGSTWRRHHAEGNACRGLWWTGDCANLLVEECGVRNNLVSGLLVENSPGPVFVRRCEITGQRVPPGLKDEHAYPAGVSISTTPGVTLESCLVAGNAMPQLNVWNVAERGDLPDFETGARTALRAENHTYRHNVFAGFDVDQTLCNLPVADRAGKGDFGWYYGSLDSDENCFWNPAQKEVFGTYERTNYRRPGLAFEGWQTFLLAHVNAGGGAGVEPRKPEGRSLWQDPLFADGPEGDYRLRAKSPANGWGLPSGDSQGEQ